MADKEKYMIKVEGKLVEVTPDVYYAYFRMGAAGALAGGKTAGACCNVL